MTELLAGGGGGGGGGAEAVMLSPSSTLRLHANSLRVRRGHVSWAPAIVALCWGLQVDETGAWTCRLAINSHRLRLICLDGGEEGEKVDKSLKI